MRWTLPVGLCLLLLQAPLVLCLTPKEYEDLGRQSAESGDYALAAQHYAKAAEAYSSEGNNSAAAVNHERSASFYSTIGSTTDYEEQAGRAAAAYELAGQDYLDSGNAWYAANAFSRSALFHNRTGKGADYRRMQTKAGETYLLVAREAENATRAAESLYRAAAALYGLDDARFASAKDQLTDLFAVLMEEALEAGDLGVFDLMDVYYLPLYSQVLADDVSSAREYAETGELASAMGAHAYAASYYSSSAIFYSYSEMEAEANSSLLLAADACWKEASRGDGWNYTSYVDSRDYMEMALYILGYLGERERIEPIEALAMARLSDLGEELQSESEILYSSGDYQGAASNFSAAAEVFYVAGREDAFMTLNAASGSAYLILAERSRASGNLTLSAAQYEQAGYLLRMGGNESYRDAYDSAAGIHATHAEGYAAAGNLSLAAGDYWAAASYYDLAGNAPAASTQYEKFISILESLAENNPNSRGSILVSIGDALTKMGMADEAREAYAEASDHLVEILGAYISSYPEYLPSIPSLPINLVKAYRLSGNLYLARNVVETLDFPAMYDTLSLLAAIARLYTTAARVHGELAASSISIYDFQAYAVDELFAGLSCAISGDLEGARRHLRDFETVSHRLHSSNRKFHQLLDGCVAWLETGNAQRLNEARSIAEEIRSVADDTQTKFLLQDLQTRLNVAGNPDELESVAETRAQAGNWSAAGEALSDAGQLSYFSEDFDRSLSHYEDSAYYFIRAARYADALESANLALETQLEPTDYVIGLRTLSIALGESNRTKADIAKASFKKAMESGYKTEKSRELLEIASDLAGIKLGVIMGQLAVGVAAALSVITVVVILRRRSRD